MAYPFIGEIQIFGCNYAPAGWAYCTGSTLPIQQYSTLFTLIGIQYGGNGSTNFQLPNLVNRIAIGAGQGPDLSPYAMGETPGANGVALTAPQIPAHTHGLSAANGPNGRSAPPVSGYALSSPVQSRIFRSEPTPNTTLHPSANGIAGTGAAHENRQPVLAMNHCIALQGEFPSFP